MTWERHGVIYQIKNKRTQLPVLSKVGNNYHLWFSSKDQRGYSQGYRLKFNNVDQIFDLNNFKRKKILENGKVGSFDTFGVMPMQEINDYLFYIGWTVRKDVPYFNFTSVAKKISNNKYEKLGPILGPDITDNGFSGTFFITKLNKNYIGYYLSQVSWEKDEKGIFNPTYDIKIALSKDLLNWEKSGNKAIHLKKNEGGISSATVIKLKNKWHMWVSVRSKRNFRDNRKFSYKIIHAYSKDALNWERTNLFSLKPRPEILGENIMTCYPNVHLYQDRIYMLYNGNGFGETGIRLATMKIKELEIFD